MISETTINILRKVSRGLALNQTGPHGIGAGPGQGTGTKQAYMVYEPKSFLDFARDNGISYGRMRRDVSTALTNKNLVSGSREGKSGRVVGSVLGALLGAGAGALGGAWLTDTDRFGKPVSQNKVIGGSVLGAILGGTGGYLGGDRLDSRVGLFSPKVEAALTKLGGTGKIVYR